ncbi:Synapsin [Trichinella spiralis]|uniref:Synapsin n=1 Tax=Trichinella spiralis TaxID=6334 RepID=A0ABR3KKD0_TRISP
MWQTTGKSTIQNKASAVALKLRRRHQTLPFYSAEYSLANNFFSSSSSLIRTAACSSQHHAKSNTVDEFQRFKDSFTQGVSFLKRRFSSSDLTDDVDDDFLHRPGDQSAAVAAQQQQQQGLHLTNEQLNVRRSNFATSAPTSPARQPHATSLMQGITKSILHAASPRQMSMSKENSKCLLIIDNQCVDWSKYFRGRKVLGDCNLRVEQTEFSKIPSFRKVIQVVA